MARLGSTAIGLGIGGVAAIFLISGILHKSLAQVLQGDIKGEPEGPTPEEKGTAEVEQSLKAHGGLPTEQENKEIFERARRGEAEKAPGEFAPPPGQAEAKVKGINSRRELAHGIQVALNYKERLEREIMRGTLSKSEGLQMFNKKYPFYKQWTEELEVLLGKR